MGKRTTTAAANWKAVWWSFGVQGKEDTMWSHFSKSLWRAA